MPILRGYLLSLVSVVMCILMSRIDMVGPSQHVAHLQLQLTALLGMISCAFVRYQLGCLR